MGFRLLELVRPFVGIIPEVEAPYTKVSFQNKCIWTGGMAVIVLFMMQSQLYGAISLDTPDPLYWLRPILASSRGSLMELGITPVLLSGLFMQVAASIGLIEVDFGLKDDRALFAAAQKIFAIGIALAQASLFIIAGLYGEPMALGVGKWFIIVTQLLYATVTTLLFDELITKGHGIGSGLSLFSAASVASTVFWQIFSLSSVDTLRGPQSEGAFIALLGLFFSWNSIPRAINEAFYRAYLPNMLNVFTTVLVFGLAVYLQGFRLELPIKSARMRSQRATYPVKLLYTSGLPIMFLAALTFSFLLLSRALAAAAPNSLPARILGEWAIHQAGWAPTAETLRADALSGLAYWISPPHSLAAAFSDPIRAVVSFAVVAIASAAVARIWIEASGSGPREVAKALKDQQMTLAGHREASIYKELKRIIPTAAMAGGATLGVLAYVADLTSPLCSGAGILVAVTITYHFFELGVKENSGMSAAGMDDMLF